MTLEERYIAFGEFSESLVAEAVWSFHEQEDSWPEWGDVLEELQLFERVESRDDANTRLEGAIRDGEVVLRSVADGEHYVLTLTLTPNSYDRITRRQMDRTMPRRDKEESW